MSVCVHFWPMPYINLLLFLSKAKAREARCLSGVVIERLYITQHTGIFHSLLLVQFPRERLNKCVDLNNKHLHGAAQP